MIGETETLRKAVTAEIDDARVVVLDLARVSRIDARGLGVLLELRELTQSKGLELRLMNVTALVQQVLEIAHLNAVFEVTSERDLQLRSFSRAIDRRSEVIFADDSDTGRFYGST